MLFRSEQGRSRNTVTAYSRDIATLFAFARDRGCEALPDIGIAELRGWLAAQRAAGLSAATMARRATAARMFFAWALAQGAIDHDPAAALVIPKVGKRLPHVLNQGQAAAVMDRAELLTDDDDPVRIRDRAMLELLYASGVRVGELVGLDIDDVDRHRRTVRVVGKGDKERVVPYGAIADAAVAD